MTKGMMDPIAAVLSEYEHDPARNEKKAVLLTPQGGYFLYGNRFCSILDYELDFRSDSCRIQGNSVQMPMFLGHLQDRFHAVGTELYKTELVSLLFHIDLGEGELLRGILLAVGEEARFALFCDQAIEELYRLSRKTGVPSGAYVLPNGSLQKYAEDMRRNDLHGLTALYLKGEAIPSNFVGKYQKPPLK